MNTKLESYKPNCCTGCVEEVTTPGLCSEIVSRLVTYSIQQLLHFAAVKLYGLVGIVEFLDG